MYIYTYNVYIYVYNIYIICIYTWWLGLIDGSGCVLVSN